MVSPVLAYAVPGGGNGGGGGGEGELTPAAGVSAAQSLLSFSVNAPAMTVYAR